MKDSPTRRCTQYQNAALVVFMLGQSGIITACKYTREMSLLDQAPLKPEVCTRGYYRLR
jgi:hypothetical protein